MSENTDWTNSGKDWGGHGGSGEKGWSQGKNFGDHSNGWKSEDRKKEAHDMRKLAEAQHRLSLEEKARDALSTAWSEAVGDVRAGVKNGIKPSYFTPWHRYFEEVEIKKQGVLYLFLAAIAIIAGLRFSVPEESIALYVLEPLRLALVTIGLVFFGVMQQKKYFAEKRRFRQMLFEIGRYDANNKEDRAVFAYICEEARLKSTNFGLERTYLWIAVGVCIFTLFYGDATFDFLFFGRLHNLFIGQFSGFVIGAELVAMNYVWRFRIA